MTQLSLLKTGGARFNADRTHRYELWRELAGAGGQVCFIMLNPSDADEHDDDRTICVCKGYGSRWGYSRLLVVNLYSFISTQPSALYESTADKTGNPENFATIMRAAAQSDLVVAAWGHHVVPLLKRGSTQVSAVLTMLLGRLSCLAITDEGAPHHPLRLRKDLRPQPYEYVTKSP